MSLVRLVQVSDFHLGRLFGWLPADRRERRRREQIEALERVVREAIERGAHGLLVPGDLFDLDAVDANTLASTISAFEIAGCPPVFIAPGNHDPWWPDSLLWSSRLLQMRDRRWPDHVHVFPHGDWSCVPLPGFHDVRIWGRCFTSSAVAHERPLAADLLGGVPRGESGRIEIAVFHGSREGAMPRGQAVTAPFSDAEALASPFTYLAVGHLHAADELTATEGRAAGTRLAYAGSAVALDVTETGIHGALEVRIEYGRRLTFIETEPIPLDARRAHDLTVDVARAGSAEQLDRRVERALDEAGATERDLARVRLEGRIARDVRYRPAARLHDRLYHLRVDTRALRPDYDLEVFRTQDPVTTEERFARALIEQLERTTDPAQRALIESALYYGLDAFALHAVTPFDEEPAA